MEVTIDQHNASFDGDAELESSPLTNEPPPGNNESAWVEHIRRKKYVYIIIAVLLLIALVLGISIPLASKDDADDSSRAAVGGSSGNNQAAEDGNLPSAIPTVSPVSVDVASSTSPTRQPSDSETGPSTMPSPRPTTRTDSVTPAPTFATLAPSSRPTSSPARDTIAPTTASPTKTPTTPPTASPTVTPTLQPATPMPTTKAPTPNPTPLPTPSPTRSPTQIPTTTSQVARIRQVVFDAALRGGSEFVSASSPQSQALAWLESQAFDAANDYAAYTDDQLIQRYALATLFYATNQVETPFSDVFFRGLPVPQWQRRNGWLTSQDHCTWQNVQCSPTDTSLPSNMVFNLTLGNNFMSGTFPDEVFVLLGDSLRVLDLNRNPTFYRNDDTGGRGPLSKLTNLLELKLSETAFAGTSGLPRELQSLTNLIWLDLRSTLYRGPLSADIFSGLSNLRYLDISFNGFVNSPLPTGFGTQMPELRYLDASENELRGRLDTLLTSAPNLNLLFLDGNYLTGTIPPNPRSTDLLALSVTNNFLTGPVPDFYTGSASYNNLKTLFFYENALTGTIPESYGKNVENLFIERNALTSKIPSGSDLCLIKLRNAQHVFQADCCICEPSGCCSACIGASSLAGECPFQTGEYKLPVQV